MSEEKTLKRPVVRWVTLKGLAAIILFFLIAVLIEYLVVIYAISLGATEKPQDALFGFIGPLFTLIPVTVIITLVAGWTFLTRYVAVGSAEAQKQRPQPPGKRRKKSRFGSAREFFGRIQSRLSKTRGVRYVTRATTKSALAVILTFSALILVVSLLAYPQLVYLTITNAYRTNGALLNFVKGVSQALAPISQGLSSITSGFISAAPGFRGAILGLSVLTSPLNNLDANGKYLVLQNIAAWTSALSALIYGEYVRNRYRYRKRK